MKARSPSLTTIKPAERRVFPRRVFKGTSYATQVGSKDSQIRLKDLSRSGASGLVEEPLAVGDYLMITFDERHRIEAQVRWTRRVMIGVEFTNLLSDDYVDELQERADQRFMAALQKDWNWSIAAAEADAAGTDSSGSAKRRKAA